MMHMMEECWTWMMSLGWVGMLLGGILLAALVVLVAVAIVRLTARRQH